MSKDNFKEIADYQGFKSDFLKLNGFNYKNIDYDAAIHIDDFINTSD
jgi:enoyl-[acyl-carrier protein] reductase/trans-2-enoyl-CoA reductase (NAD+)